MLYIKTYYTEVYWSVTNEQHNTTTGKPKREPSRADTGLSNLSSQKRKNKAGRGTVEKSLTPKGKSALKG